MDSSTRLQTFIDLVSALTGVSARVAGQAEAAAQYLENYTHAADGIAGAGATDALLGVFAAGRQKLPPEKVAKMLFYKELDGSSPDPAWPFSAMTRNLMKFVLLGVWYDPNKPGDDGTIPTAASYSEGLVWLIAQAHPVGASQLAYGYWANPPPSLKDLIG
ncbi:hypothetical protein JJB09_21525 [Rhizobium sp. KVB221]|uniref:Sorbitol dehydrogenase n=1 Tax=Rhizobium setariae TaxID=2801340 RepID=A0A936YVM1_9HYPH|nr:hypothetical protein [Rhizobium setariae]MBL0374596.1 hypothetical protein [Rhizobium setariae]